MKIAEKYARTRSDLEYLESCAPLDYWTPVHENVEEFMQNPTLKFAEGMYRSAIGLWFNERVIEQDGAGSDDPRVVEIAERYGETL